MNESEPKNPNEMSDAEIDQLGVEAEQEREAHSEALRKEIDGIQEIDGLLARAEELVVYANPLHPEYTDDSNAFIIEARKRLQAMGDGAEKNRLQERLDAVYSDYSQRGNI